MSKHSDQSAAWHDGPPTVDEGDPPYLLPALLRALAPAPGRLGNTVRLVALVAATVAVSETFRIPNTAVSAYVVLFVSRAERVSTIKTALAAGIAVILALLITIVVFMASLSDPALRLPLIAIVTFAAMFTARVSPLGPLLFAGGFIIAYGLTLGDSVLKLSLQQATVADAAPFTLPELAFAPPEEALIYTILWLAVAVALPVGLVIVVNLLTGSDPAVELRLSLTERLAAAGRACAGEPGAATTLAALTRTGTAELQTLQQMSNKTRGLAIDPALIDAIERLCLAILAITRLPTTIWPGEFLVGAANICGLARASLLDDAAFSAVPLPPFGEANLAVRPVVAELSHALALIQANLVLPGAPAASASKQAKPKTALLLPDAFTNPAHTRFALKVTLAMLFCYVGESLLDWPGIHTCIITCFFVSLGTVGETVHKASLRIAGCLIGAALGIGTIVLLMPSMTDIGDLLLVVSAVTFLAGWVGSCSERIAYAGWQIGLAFYLTVLQGNGPTLDMETARDRIVGILVGNAVIFVIFTVIWPVRVSSVVRPALAKAIGQLAELLDLLAVPPPETKASELHIRRTLGATFAQASGVLVNDPFERHLLRPSHPAGIDIGVLRAVQDLLVPISALLDLRDVSGKPGPIDVAGVAYGHAMAAWLRHCAEWVFSGTGGANMMATLPPPPHEPGEMLHTEISNEAAARTVWLTILHRDIHAILAKIGPQPRPIVGAPISDVIHAMA